MEQTFSPGDSVLKVVTDVVPATKSLMPKSIRRIMQYHRARNISEEKYSSTFCW